MPLTELLECVCCRNVFNITTRKPIILLNCGHTFCESCTKSLLSPKCPTCRATITTTDTDQIIFAYLSLILNIETSTTVPKITTTILPATPSPITQPLPYIAGILHTKKVINYLNLNNITARNMRRNIHRLLAISPNYLAESRGNLNLYSNLQPFLPSFTLIHLLIKFPKHNKLTQYLLTQEYYNRRGIQSDGSSYLLVAICFKNTKFAKWLITHKDNTPNQYEQVYAQCIATITALSYNRDYFFILKHMVSHYPRLIHETNATDDTLLISIVRANCASVDVINYLVAQGIDIDHANLDGMTALMYAVQNFDIFQHLVAIGANITVRNRINNYTICDISSIYWGKNGGNAEVKKYIMDKYIECVSMGASQQNADKVDVTHKKPTAAIDGKLDRITASVASFKRSIESAIRKIGNNQHTRIPNTDANADTDVELSIY